VKQEEKKKNVFLENVGFTFDHQAKIWPVDGVTKGHVKYCLPIINMILPYTSASSSCMCMKD
jgi:hypothetical protein